MNFLYPGFLFSLLAVIIPVAIHLFNFRKFKVVYFSNVQFLKAVQEQHASREKLKNLLILISRILAVIFLVLAFARPYLRSGIDSRPDQTNVVTIYIDNSYSMDLQNTEGSLLDEAKRWAKQIAAGFSANDRFLLMTNDFEGKHQRKLNEEELVQAIDELKISPAQRTLQQVLNRQQSAQHTGMNSFFYLLSDFQEHFVGKPKLAKSFLKVDSNVSVSLIRLTPNAQPNVAVDSIWSLSPAHRPNDSERFVVALHNYGQANSENTALKLVVNGQQKALATVAIPAGQSVKDTLNFSGLTAGWQKGSVSIKDYPVTFDDTLDFSFRVNAGLRVLHITGASLAGVADAAVGAMESPDKYLKALFAADPYFRMNTMPASNVVYSSLSSYPLIIVSGLQAPSSGLAEQLKNFVHNGGSLVIFPDLNSSTANSSSFLNQLALPAAERLSTDTVAVSAIDLQSNVFTDVFEQIPSRLDLPKVYRHFIYRKSHKSNREDILSLPFNQQFFSRYPLGAGKVYLFSSSLDAKDSNLAQHPVFVPLMYKVAFLSVQEQPLYYSLGKNILLSSQTIALDHRQSLRLRSAALEIIPEVKQVPGKTLLYIADQVKKRGFFELRKADSLLSVYAFNEDRGESDLRYRASADLEQLFPTKNITINNSGASLSPVSIKNNHTELWKLCIVLCAVFLAVEVILTRFFNNPKKIQKT